MPLDILDILKTGLMFTFRFWWVWVPLILGMAAYREWFGYQRTKYLAGMKWVLLELIPPPDIPFSSPKAADSLFAGLHGMYGINLAWKPQFFTGKVPDWFSFETVSNGGEIHFYIRCPEGQRNHVESLVFAQYPEAEIRVADDYIALIPEHLDLAQYDTVGMEMEFTKDPAYPIKTYQEFEEAGGKDEYARLDPIAPLVEIMSALRPSEHLWVQYVLRPTGGEWAKAGQKVIDKIIGKEEKKEEPPLAGVFKAIDTTLGIAPEEKKEEKKQFSIQNITPAQKAVLERVEYKLAHLAFKVGIRILYVARKDVFNGSRTATVAGMFKQLYNNSMNTFKPGNGTWDAGALAWIFPSGKGFFAAQRVAEKKKAIYANYRRRSFPHKYLDDDEPELGVILTTEELATLWHLPGLNVKAPLLPRVQAKKGQPPALLPTR